MNSNSINIDVTRGCTGCTCTPPPQGGEKKLGGGQIYRGKLLVHPQAESAPPKGRARVHFSGNWGDLGGWRGYLGSYCVWF